MSAQEYVEAIARELSRLKGRGLLMSPADSALALAWHAQGVPLPRVLSVLRDQGPRLVPLAARRAQSGPQASAPPQIGLSLFASALSLRPSVKTLGAPRPATLAAELLESARNKDLPAADQWMALAHRADELLAGDPEAQRDYWDLALLALRSSLRELGGKAQAEAGAALRERRAPRPAGMSRRRYRRSLQLQLLSASSERLGVPPRAFLL